MMMVGIDYGRRKIGIALGDSDVRLAAPYFVVRVRSQKNAIQRIIRILKSERIEQIVLGVSEGKMGEETKKFGIYLSSKTPIPMMYQDETLSSHDAQRLSIELGIKRKKRKRMEDAYAASLILQAYFDELI